MREGLWIFGYGSLVWRPAFEHQQRRPGFIRGYMRRFWQASPDHRGTPEAPGRVATLVPAADETVWGMAYQLQADAASEVLERLDQRERAGYERVETAIHLSESDGSTPTVEGLVYIAGETNPNYLGPLAIAEIVDVVAHAQGPSGGNIEYVLELDRALAAMGASDAHVRALAQALTASER